MGVKLCKLFNKLVGCLQCLEVVDNQQCLECLECLLLVVLILTNLLKAVFLVTFSLHDLPSPLIQR